MDFSFHNDVSIQAGKTTLRGVLSMPLEVMAVVVFSHGSGSSRFSKRNRQVAHYLHEKNIGTLLFDLLTEEEDRYYANRFDIELLTKRLVGATEWLEKYPVTKQCRTGYFGASSGAASALKAAAIMPQVQAVVSRGGRPDLAMDDLYKVNAPTLLIVGSLDGEVIELNRQAYMKLQCEKKMEIVEGAAHLFEEPGKMEIVSALAAGWFEKFLIPVKSTPG